MLQKFQKGFFSQLSSSPAFTAQFTSYQKSSNSNSLVGSTHQSTTSLHRNKQLAHTEQSSQRNLHNKSQNQYHSNLNSSPQFAKNQSNRNNMSFLDRNSICQIVDKIEQENLFGNQEQNFNQVIDFQPYDSSMINITMLSKNPEREMESKGNKQKQKSNKKGKNQDKENIIIQKQVQKQVEVKRDANQKKQSPINSKSNNTPILSQRANPKTADNIQKQDKNKSRSQSKSKLHQKDNKPKSTTPKKVVEQKTKQNQQDPSIQQQTTIQPIKNANIPTFNQNLNGQQCFLSSQSNKFDSQDPNQSQISFPPQQNYTSRNHTNHIQNNSRNQQQSQSTLCNMGSVKNKDQFVLNFQQQESTESFPFMMQTNQIKELKDQVQSLNHQIHQLKQKASIEKEKTLEHLKDIEENYQKYAFYYTKYLEEKIVFAECQKNQEELSFTIQKQNENISYLNLLVFSILDMCGQKSQDLQRLRQSISQLVQKAMIDQMINDQETQQRIQSLQIQISDLVSQRQSSNQFPAKIPQIDFTPQQQQNDQDVEQVYQTGYHNRSQSQQFNKTRSDQKARKTRSGGRSSTPKTQLRYHESKDEEDDELYHFQHFPSAMDFSVENQNQDKREIATKIFRQSIQSPPPPYDSIEERVLEEGLRVVTGNSTTNQSATRQIQQIVQQIHDDSQNFSNQNTKISIKDSQINNQNATANSMGNIYNYTLKSFHYEDDSAEKTSSYQQVTTMKENSLFGNIDKTNCNDYNGIIPYDLHQQRQQQQTMSRNLSQYTNEVLNSLSKLDTFSPKDYQEQIHRQSQQNLQTLHIDDGLQPKQLKYSVEFVNKDEYSDEDDNDENNLNHQIANRLIHSQNNQFEVSNAGSHNLSNQMRQISSKRSSNDDNEQCKIMASTKDLDNFHFNTQQLRDLQNNYSQDQQSTSPPTIQSNNRTIEIAVAEKQFVGEKENDLSFKVGQKIIIEQRIKGSNWMFGSIGLKQGWFPADYVKIEEHYL
ncbi:UNKNOWN [Stylonychia lemnae]|uniref:SH3 domain-containing protein n=1 Tax=Stylonychia lemnae TaxID=5949 RepID=A0A078A8S9_STYLE|nr:UNKNOWN [Stylonychia lemnae]|eukprot:CDW77947.1 UNKNOWN [Stylonychia lemnae]